ncbi:MAG: hypothetical protein B7Y80_20870 [Hyphomicrobium sp. 32-62-53]|nr:MAG: hypothetical protein B7Z29_20820 [Hyphomicrobium sp. 12-62-95]OYX97113.1 MAG: hypothetical protein B7Y80_20870 [Hyphomicrobium sp. 32-62-53]
MIEVGNEQARRAWLKGVLSSARSGASLLDIGAGECQFKELCGHLNYVAQDISIYDGKGDQAGLQTRTWDTSKIDIVCDLLDIPETIQYDYVLCTEVLEHVPDPVKAVEKMARLVKPAGEIVITAPFCSLTHFAPFHYATGFSSYFYKYHFERLGLEVLELTPNGGFFDYLDQELRRTRSVRATYAGAKLNIFDKVAMKFAARIARRLATDDGPRDARRSAELLTFGWHVRARKP